MRKAEVQMFGQTAGYLTEDDNGEYQTSETRQCHQGHCR